jgi:hypothetical protein
MNKLIRIYYLSIRRNSLFYENLAKKILITLGFSYIFANLLFISFFLNKILAIIQPDSLPFDTFCRFFLFIWVVDIIVKFFLKSNMHIDILPFLTLPIKKRKIFTLMLCKELLSKWNFIWVVLFTPFLLKTFYPLNGLFSTVLLIFLIYFIGVTISIALRLNHVLTLFKSNIHYIVPLFVSVILFYFAYNIFILNFSLFNFNELFISYRNEIIVILLILITCLYLFFLILSKKEIYLIQVGKSKSIQIINIHWFKNSGSNMEIYKLCLKEITRSQLKFSLFTSILFTLAICLNTSNDINFIKQFCYSIAPLVLLGSMFSECTFTAESTFFDKLSTLPNEIIFQILKTKYLIFIFFAVLFAVILTITTINKIPIIHWVSFCLFGIGTISFFMFQNTVYNLHRLDMMGSLRKVSNINLHSFITMGLLMLIFGIIILIDMVSSENSAIYSMLILGTIFTITSPLWLRNIYNRFLKRKYQNMNGFRTI